MAKIKRYTPADGGYHGELAIICPGCNCKHWIFDKETESQSKYWEFNDNYESPTISPSVLVTWEEGEERTQRRCHSFIRNGQIQFLNDCDHELAGKTVELPQTQ